MPRSDGRRQDWSLIAEDVFRTSQQIAALLTNGAAGKKERQHSKGLASLTPDQVTQISTYVVSLGIRSQAREQEAGLCGPAFCRARNAPHLGKR